MPLLSHINIVITECKTVRKHGTTFIRNFAKVCQMGQKFEEDTHTEATRLSHKYGYFPSAAQLTNPLSTICYSYQLFHKKFDTGKYYLISIPTDAHTSKFHIKNIKIDPTCFHPTITIRGATLSSLKSLLKLVTD